MEGGSWHLVDTAKIIILRKIKYSESDLVIQGLDQRGGRLNLLARGALKSKRRFGGGVLEPTHYVQVHFRRKSSGLGEGQLGFLEEAHLLEDFKGLREEYSRLETAFYFLRLVSQLSQEGDEGSVELFDLLGNALRACAESSSLSLLKVHFELKLLHQQGVMPPDLSSLESFSRPLMQHQEIELDGQALAQTGQQVHFVLKSYLER